MRYHPVPIPDGAPTEDEIAAAVQSLRTGRAPGPIGLKVEDIREWMSQPDGIAWGNLVSLVQHCFAIGELPQHLCHSILVLIPKAAGGLKRFG